MRRTDNEFKAEVFRRSREYRARQKKILKKTLAMVPCVTVCLLGAFLLLVPMGGSDTASAEMAVLDHEEMNQVYQPEESPAAAEPNYSTSVTGDVGVIPSIRVYSQPESEQYDREFTDPKQIKAIMDAISEFYNSDAPEEMPEGFGDCNGMRYVILVTDENGIHSFTLFNNGLYSEEEQGWVGVDKAAFDALEELIRQKSE